MDNNIYREALKFIEASKEVESKNEAARIAKENLKKSIEELAESNRDNAVAYDIATHAIEILQSLTNDAVQKAYRFLEDRLNETLERMFVGTKKKVHIHEYLRDNKHPQLEIVIKLENGKVQDLSDDSGHGVAQLTSILCLLSLIVITGSRKIMVMDEVVSGLSVHNRKILNDIIWCFAEIGFQFIICEHGFIPSGSQVYHMEEVGGVSHIKDQYIATKGVYLQGKDGEDYDYKEEIEELESETEEFDNTIKEDVKELANDMQNYVDGKSTGSESNNNVICI